jgi:hypothetical protein
MSIRVCREKSFLGTPRPPIFLDLFILKGFKFNEFGSAHSKGVVGANFGSGDILKGLELFWGTLIVPKSRETGISWPSCPRHFLLETHVFLIILIT